MGARSMREFFARFQLLVQDGSYPVVLALLFLGTILWLLLLERGAFLFRPWSFRPGAKSRIAAKKSQVLVALDHYLESPSRTRRAIVVSLARRLGGPSSRFLERVLTGPGLQPSTVRDVQLAEAFVRQAAEIERGLGWIAILSKASLGLGLLGALTGVIQAFSAWMASASPGPTALPPGFWDAIDVMEVGLLVALPGILGRRWLARRAQNLEEEISLVSMRLRTAGPEVPDSAPDSAEVFA